jgi:opacity protein-like surface antigen
MGQWMPYAGIGVAFANLEIDATGPGGASTARETQPGLNLLAGIKYQWTPNWEIGVQYNHTIFARESYLFTGPFTAPVVGISPIQVEQNSFVGLIDYKIH